MTRPDARASLVGRADRARSGAGAHHFSGCRRDLLRRVERPGAHGRKQRPGRGRTAVSRRARHRRRGVRLLRRRQRDLLWGATPDAFVRTRRVPGPRPLSLELRRRLSFGGGSGAVTHLRRSRHVRGHVGRRRPQRRYHLQPARDHGDGDSTPRRSVVRRRRAVRPGTPLSLRRGQQRRLPFRVREGDLHSLVQRRALRRRRAGGDLRGAPVLDHSGRRRQLFFLPELPRRLRHRQRLRRGAYLLGSSPRRSGGGSNRLDARLPARRSPRTARGRLPRSGWNTDGRCLRDGTLRRSRGARTLLLALRVGPALSRRSSLQPAPRRTLPLSAGLRRRSRKLRS